ncbi:MAG TPA: archease [Streptosporangiaceae bacterium]|jgi:SHS2 domain-containing protein|nr:archease [Streptosporangiaceae bacterium]
MAVQAGHRAVPHTADLRIEAWAGSCHECVAESLRGLVDSVADVRGAEATRTAECELTGASPADLLAAAVEEVIYILDTAGQIPVSVHVRPAGSAAGMIVTLELASAGDIEFIGAVPKAVSFYGLTCGPDASGRWSATMTVDV